MEALELQVSKWLNTTEPLSLEKLNGKVVAIHAFQMLCPGCVLHGIPQAKRLYELLNPEYLAVLGLHTVFEHHDGMQEPSLMAFLHEFRVKFPVAIDAPSPDGRIPKTMKAYDMRGTPTWLIFDKKGDLKIHSFGQMDDLVLASEITKLIYQDLTIEKNIYRK